MVYLLLFILFAVASGYGSYLDKEDEDRQRTWIVTGRYVLASIAFAFLLCFITWLFCRRQDAHIGHNGNIVAPQLGDPSARIERLGFLQWDSVSLDREEPEPSQPEPRVIYRVARAMQLLSCLPGKETPYGVKCVEQGRIRYSFPCVWETDTVIWWMDTVRCLFDDQRKEAGLTAVWRFSSEEEARAAKLAIPPDSVYVSLPEEWQWITLQRKE